MALDNRRPNVLAVIMQTDTPDSGLIGADRSYTWLIQALSPEKQRLPIPIAGLGR